jgi:hypothetical protein
MAKGCSISLLPTSDRQRLHVLLGNDSLVLGLQKFVDEKSKVVFRGNELGRGSSVGG